MVIVINSHVHNLVFIDAMRAEEELQVANYYWKHGVVHEVNIQGVDRIFWLRHSQ